MSEGSFKKKLLPAWASLILVPPTGRGAVPFLSLLFATLSFSFSSLSLCFHLCRSFGSTSYTPHEFTSLSILIPSSVTFVSSHTLSLGGHVMDLFQEDSSFKVGRLVFDVAATVPLLVGDSEIRSDVSFRSEHAGTYYGRDLKT